MIAMRGFDGKALLTDVKHRPRGKNSTLRLWESHGDNLNLLHTSRLPVRDTPPARQSADKNRPLSLAQTPSPDRNSLMGQATPDISVAASSFDTGLRSALQEFGSSQERQGRLPAQHQQK